MIPTTKGIEIKSIIIIHRFKLLCLFCPFDARKEGKLHLNGKKIIVHLLA